MRRQKVLRKRYASDQDRRGVINNHVSIDERPEIVSEKSRIGDWGGDTLIGKNHKGGLVTLAERKSRHVLAPYKDQCHTITFDNEKEFSEHEKVAKDLETSIYFAHPYHSWERGLQVQNAVEKLNHRPRKVLGFRTPNEVFLE